MRILGISSHYHDSAAALIVDGRIVAAAQEERFSRIKNDARFPLLAARYCLAQGQLHADALDAIAYYEKPFVKFDRLIVSHFHEAPRGLRRFLAAMPSWFASRLWLRREIARQLDTTTGVYFMQHHESHAASAFGPSPFAQAAVLTLDGVGEWTTNSIWHARGSTLEPMAEIRYPDSLGLLYSAFTSYCGFSVNEGEYKLMGLAPYGEQRHVDTILRHVVELREDGSYHLNPELFAYRYAESMTTPAFHRLFGGEPRSALEPLRRRHADLARSIQAVTEQIILRQARQAQRLTGERILCMAGGVALNCVANARLLGERLFDKVWIQPASGDAGGALGAALALWFRLCRPARASRTGDSQSRTLLGPQYTEEEMQAALTHAGLGYERLLPDRLVDATAHALANGEVIGWFKGRMEYGPRALGSRSILADPRLDSMQSHVNRAVKFREGFRPFAPVVREASADSWFEMPDRSPYMLLTGRVRGAQPSPLLGADEDIGRQSIRVQSPIPAVTHVDCSARVQTIPTGEDPILESLLEKFGALTGCDVLLNTSFNIKDEPIVCSPADAVECFCRSGIDRLVLGPFLTAPITGDKPTVASTPRTSDPSASVDRRRIWTDLLGGCCAFMVMQYLAGARKLAILALLVSGGLALLRMITPRGHAATLAAVTWIARRITQLALLPALAAVYWLLFAPVGLLRRLRAPPARESSYWRKPLHPDHDPRLPY